MIDIILDDIVDGICNGIEAVDPYAQPIIIFLNLVCFIADYSAVSPVLDIKSHTANAPFPACTFVKQKDAYDSDYAHSKLAHFQNPSNFRSLERTTAIRKSSNSREVFKSIGVREDLENNWNTTPLFAFHSKLTSKCDIIPNTNSGTPVNLSLIHI